MRKRVAAHDPEQAAKLIAVARAEAHADCQVQDVDPILGQGFVQHPDYAGSPTVEMLTSARRLTGSAPHPRSQQDSSAAALTCRWQHGSGGGNGAVAFVQQPARACLPPA